MNDAPTTSAARTSAAAATGASEHLRPEEVAARFDITRAQVMAFCASKAWPHERFGRRVRFTLEQVAQIEALHSVAPKSQPVNAWGRKTRRAS